MSDMIKNLSQMLNDGNIPDNVKEMFNNFSSNSNGSNNSSSNANEDSSEDTSSNSSNSFSGIDFETILKMKSIMEKMNSKDDPRANLLLSLKPYLKESRKNKVEQYIKLFNMSKVIDVFGGMGGENKR